MAAICGQAPVTTRLTVGGILSIDTPIIKGGTNILLLSLALGQYSLWFSVAIFHRQ